MEKLAEKDHILPLLSRVRGNGSMINSMESALKSISKNSKIKMRNMKDNSKTDDDMDSDATLTGMEIDMRAIGLMIPKPERDHISGLLARNSSAILWRMIEKDMENLFGRTLT